MRLSRVFRTTGFRLAALYAAIFGTSVLVLFGVIYWTAGSAMYRQLAANIRTETAGLVDDYRTGGLSETAKAIRLKLASGVRPMTFYLLRDPQGRNIAGNLSRTRAEAGWQDLPLPPKQVKETGDDPEDSASHHLSALGTVLPDGSFLLVGEDLFPVGEVKEAIGWAFAWAFVLGVLLAVVGGSVLSLGFLRRVDAINRTTRAIISGSLADRVPTRGTGDELDRLAVNLNEMLDRIQALMESLRQVSNDIAHDLRTPLSRIRQRLEDIRLNARGPEDYRAAVENVIADTDQVLETFSALLRIAQIEAGTRKAGFSRLDLSGVFQSIAHVYTAVAEDRGQTLVTSISPGVDLLGDRELLTQMLANLVENAIRHAPQGALITLALEQGPRGPLGVVADTGPGIPAADRDKVFRPFFRLERSRSTPGSGLGLSLVNAVAEIHGAAVELGDNAPGLRVTLEFAQAAESASQD
ncbi:MAG: HAMP domain-containing sensor histidine kinase [Arenicellales bacterium]